MAGEDRRQLVGVPQDRQGCDRQPQSRQRRLPVPRPQGGIKYLPVMQVFSSYLSGPGPRGSVLGMFNSQ